MLKTPFLLRSCRTALNVLGRRSYSNRRLEGKNVLITGASAGIGEACAREFAKEGSNLILAARRADRLELLKQELSQKHAGIQIHTLSLDVREKKNIDKAVAELPTKDVDVLVNNAGLVIGMDHLDKVSEEAYDTMFDTNVKGLVFLTQALLPHMKARQAGHIINLGSVAVMQAAEFTAVGNKSRKMRKEDLSLLPASKFAVEAITRALLYELVDTPIRVSQVCPGMVNTEFSTIRFGGDKKKADEVYKGLQPLVGQDIGTSLKIYMVCVDCTSPQTQFSYDS
ncbi:hypothetical protein EC973_004520 [Apophysomyces ossiformis]|uniref:Uncharacterized protein n=1 Tax=Apophysomyces ossiformis TaxID=679940 RepID=A0A8H7BL55_9FUNG|nr:hypothetical protein EC973_004520 [Apophysomyces ossiformis]